MSTRGIIVTIILVVIVVIAAVWLFGAGQQAPVVVTNNSSSTTGVVATDMQQMTLAGGQISLSYPADVFGLAAAPEPLTVKSYIPPCDPSYDYCFFYNTSTYVGTNFESAGLRVTRRTDLVTQSTCLSTQPAGYQNQKVLIATSSDYAAGTFGPLGDAGAGHLASGYLYRLWTGGSCYEFETRIGNTQFANYPSGTIQEFTDADRADVQSSLQQILNAITLASSGEAIIFP